MGVCELTHIKASCIESKQVSSSTFGSLPCVSPSAPDAYSTNVFCRQVDTGPAYTLGLRKARRTNMSHRITKDQAETMVTMIDAGWTLAAIAAHFGVDVKEVEQAIVKQVKSERKQGDDQRRGK